MKKPKPFKAWAIWFPDKGCYLGEGDALGVWFYNRRPQLRDLPRAYGGRPVQVTITPGRLLKMTND